MKEIIDRVPEPAILEQLAEECTELAKAALKYSRWKREENPTPASGQELVDEMFEEIADVRLMINVVDEMYYGIDTDEIEESKLIRWKQRLRGHQKRNSCSDW